MSSTLTFQHAEKMQRIGLRGGLLDHLAIKPLGLVEPPVAMQCNRGLQLAYQFGCRRPAHHG